MVDEFQVILEDDSPYHVAKHLFGLYNQCVQGDFTEVERLREKFKLQNQFAASSCMKQASDDEDDSGDEDNVSHIEYLYYKPACIPDVIYTYRMSKVMKMIRIWKKQHQKNH